MSKQLDSLLQKEMTRKEFLTTIGFSLASLFGFSTVLKLLAGGKHSTVVPRQNNAGYGSSPYGGSKS